MCIRDRREREREREKQTDRQRHTHTLTHKQADRAMEQGKGGRVKPVFMSRYTTTCEIQFMLDMIKPDLCFFYANTPKRAGQDPSRRQVFVEQ